MDTDLEQLWGARVVSAIIVAVQLIAAKLSTYPRCATLQDGDREPGALRLTTSALSGLGHDSRTIFRRELYKLSHQTLKVTHITSHTRKLSAVSDHPQGPHAPGQRDSADFVGTAVARWMTVAELELGSSSMCSKTKPVTRPVPPSPPAYPGARSGWRSGVARGGPEVLIISFHPLERPIKTNGGMVSP